MELKPDAEPPVRPGFWRRVLAALFALLQIRANGYLPEAKPQPPQQRGDGNE